MDGLSELDERSRNVVSLYISGMGVSEISNRLGISEVVVEEVLNSDGVMKYLDEVECYYLGKRMDEGLILDEIRRVSLEWMRDVFMGSDDDMKLNLIKILSSLGLYKIRRK